SVRGRRPRAFALWLLCSLVGGGGGYPGKKKKIDCVRLPGPPPPPQSPPPRPPNTLPDTPGTSSPLPSPSHAAGLAPPRRVATPSPAKSRLRGALPPRAPPRYCSAPLTTAGLRCSLQKDITVKMLGDGVLFLVSVVISALLLFGTVFFVIMLSDLESDYINPIDLCNKLNQFVVPEMGVHGFLFVLLLVNGSWFAVLLTLPLLAYNVDNWILSSVVLFLVVPNGLWSAGGQLNAISQEIRKKRFDGLGTVRSLPVGLCWMPVRGCVSCAYRGTFRYYFDALIRIETAVFCSGNVFVAAANSFRRNVGRAGTRRTSATIHCHPL
ncbi:MAG: cornichon protein-domain-containing protein, partial [Olpidium bornovanus]